MIIDKVDGCIEEKNGNKYLTQIKTKNYWQNTQNFGIQLKIWLDANSTEKTSNKSSEHEEDLIKIKCNSDDNLPLNKILKIHNMAIVIRSVFEEDGKYYPQALLDECLYEIEMLKIR